MLERLPFSIWFDSRREVVPLRAMDKKCFFFSSGRNFTAGEGLCHSDGKALAAWSSHKS